MNPRVALAALGLLLAAACSSGKARSGGSASASRPSAAPGGSPAAEDDGESIVIASLDGASAAVLESDVARPIEEAIVACEGVASVRSRCGLGRAEVHVALATGAEPDGVRACVRERIAASSRVLPTGVATEIRRPRRPTIALVTFADREPARIVLGPDAPRMRELLEPIPGVTEVRVCAPGRAVMVEVDPAKLRSTGLAVGAVARALEAWRFDGSDQKSDVAQVEAIELLQRGGARVKLSDVASVRADVTPDGCRATGDAGEPTVAIEVRGVPGAGPRVAAAIASRDFGTDAHVHLASVEARMTSDWPISRGARDASESLAPPRDPDGMVPFVALAEGRDLPLTVWLAPPADATGAWWIAAATRLAPPADWAWRSIEAPSGGAPSRSVWIALAGGAGGVGECVAAGNAVASAVGELALPGTLEQIGEGAPSSGKPEVILAIDRAMAADVGASVAEIAGTLRLIRPLRVGATGVPKSDPPVWVRIAGDQHVGSLLGRIDVETSRGLVALSSLVRTSEGDAPVDRARVGGRSALVVSFVARPSAVVPDEAWVREKVGAGACKVVGVGTGAF